VRDLALAALVVLTLAGCARVGPEPLPGRPAHHVAGGFRNTNPEFKRPDPWTRWAFLARRAWTGLFAPRHIDLAVAPGDGAGIRAGDAGPSITWVGHSTLLVRLPGVNLLTDPHWGPRASPLSWAGPRRLTPPGVAFERLPPIHLVLISHDHYDSLDLGTVQRLAREHDPLFLVPLGLKAWFAQNGITRVEELDWWETREHRGLRVVCVPAQHWSQRGFRDLDTRLWASWVVVGGNRRLFVGGDSGYFDGFRTIGERLGPFDLAAMPIGAYMPAAMMRWSHTTPEEAVQAARDLQARVLLGIHWGTFDLGEEPLDEPPARMLAEASRRGFDAARAWILRPGETRGW
jgi:N-acyl-phosphatidylethanolamine-hydrolysing phospholipase D